MESNQNGQDGLTESVPKVGVTGDQVLRIRRTTAVAGVVMGVVSVVALSVAGYPQAGIGACVGLAFGAWMLNSLVKVALSVPESQVQSAKKQFIASRMVRLTAVTGGVLILCFAARQVGFGALGGLAAFYIVMLVNALVAVQRSLHAPLPPGVVGQPVSPGGSDVAADSFGFGTEDR